MIPPALARRASLALNLVFAAVALALAVAAPGSSAAPGPAMRLAADEGALSISNSKTGSSIFWADNLRPGDDAGGTVRIGNTGQVAGVLSVRATLERDDVGLYGGRLSSRLTFMLIDVTVSTRPVTVYAGPLDGMGSLPLGTVEPGTEHAFVLVASLDRGGPADNAIQGATHSTGFEWTLSPLPTATPTPTPTPTATPSPTVQAPTATPAPAPSPTPVTLPAGPAGADPTGTVLGAQVFKLPSSRRCVSRRKFTITLRRPKGLAFKALEITVNRRTRLKLKGLRARRVKTRISLRRLPKGKVVVKIVATTTTGRRAVTKRTYHTCAAKRTTAARRR